MEFPDWLDKTRRCWSFQAKGILGPSRGTGEGSGIWRFANIPAKRAVICFSAPDTMSVTLS